MALKGNETLEVRGVLSNGIPSGSTEITTTQAIANLGGSGPVINTAFAKSVASLNLPVLKDYVFGANATAGIGQTAIRNVNDLGLEFNPYEVNTGTNTVNSEWQRYQPFSSAANFVFNSDNLALTGTLTSGTTATATAYSVVGNFSGSTNSFTLANASITPGANITVGQLMFQIFRGFYYVTSNDGTTIATAPLYGSDTTLGPFTPLVFPTAYYAVTNSTTAAGNGVLHFAAVPSGVTAGQTIGFQTSATNQTSSQEYTVLSKTSNSVTITPVLAAADAVSSGEGVFFLPGIHSGQIWTKNTYNMPGQNGATYFAMELTVRLPQNNNGYFDPATSNTNASLGAWPAFWMRADTLGGNDNLNELDVGEWYNSAFSTMAAWQPNLISPTTGNNVIWASTIADFLFNPPLWNITGLTPGNFQMNPLYTYNSPVDLSLAIRKFALLFTPDKAYVYLDGVMMKSVPWHWTSSVSPQIAVNLAIGSLQSGLGSNGLFPINDLNFLSLFMNLYELKFWGM